MTFLNLFRRRGSAPVARERLQILLSYERAARGQSDLLALLREVPRHREPMHAGADDEHRNGRWEHRRHSIQIRP